MKRTLNRTGGANFSPFKRIDLDKNGIWSFWDNESKSQAPHKDGKLIGKILEHGTKTTKWEEVNETVQNNDGTVSVKRSGKTTLETELWQDQSELVKNIKTGETKTAAEWLTSTEGVKDNTILFFFDYESCKTFEINTKGSTSVINFLSEHTEPEQLREQGMDVSLSAERLDNGYFTVSVELHTLTEAEKEHNKNKSLNVHEAMSEEIKKVDKYIKSTKRVSGQTQTSAPPAGQAQTMNSTVLNPDGTPF